MLRHQAEELPKLDLRMENKFAGGGNIRCAPGGVCARSHSCAAC
jgi:hypothetical protein